MHGMGSDQFSQFYNTVGIMPDNYEDGIQPTPYNVSTDSISQLTIKNVANNKRMLQIILEI